MCRNASHPGPGPTVETQRGAFYPSSSVRNSGLFPDVISQESENQAGFHVGFESCRSPPVSFLGLFPTVIPVSGLCAGILLRNIINF